MNKILPAIISFLFIQSFCFGQSTWIRTPYLDSWTNFPIYNDSTVVGPDEIAITPNGNVISNVRINQAINTWIYAVDKDGNFKWYIDAGNSQTLHQDFCYSLHPTNDNGCVYILDHYIFNPSSEYHVYKLDSLGHITWSLHFWDSSINYQRVISITPTPNNTYILLFSDSIAELDQNGGAIQSIVQHQESIEPLPGGDFIASDLTMIDRGSFSGSFYWSLPSANFFIASTNLSFTYARSEDTVMKINSFTGNIIWQKAITNSVFSATSDSGFIIASGQYPFGDSIVKYDMNGIVQWSKYMPFPKFGYLDIKETNTHGYALGGCWRNYDLQSPDAAFSPFIMQTDSLCNGVIDSTDYFYIGNANNNNTVSFGNDAVYIAAAMGNSGIARDIVMQNIDAQNTYVTQWSSGFANGINYRFSDYDGNGIIDSSDIIKMARNAILYTFPYSNVTPEYLRYSNLNLTMPTLYFSMEDSLAMLGDTIKIDVILGSPSLLVDSIYGLSFDLKFNGIINSGPVISFYSIKPTALGDTSSDLYVYYSGNQNIIPITSSMVLCRTNHINAYVAGDTITTLYYIFPPSSGFQNPVSLNVNWNAITFDGSPVALNLVTDSLYLSSTTGINSSSTNNFKIFPNPADDKIIFSFNTEKVNVLMINDQTGRMIKSVNDPESNYILNTKEFPAGIYYVSVLMEDRIGRSRFVVAR